MGSPSHLQDSKAKLVANLSTQHTYRNSIDGKTARPEQKQSLVNKFSDYFHVTDTNETKNLREDSANLVEKQPH